MDRLDEIFGDDVVTAALPVTDCLDIREVLKRSIEVNGIHATAEHWRVMLDHADGLPLESFHEIRNDLIADQF